MNYIPRPLGARIVAAHSNVVVLEGARAVGKTMLAKKKIVPYGFEYVTLADDATYQLAKTDISSWVRNLQNLSLSTKLNASRRSRSPLKRSLTSSAQRTRAMAFPNSF